MGQVGRGTGKKSVSGRERACLKAWGEGTMEYKGEYSGEGLVGPVKLQWEGTEKL